MKTLKRSRFILSLFVTGMLLGGLWGCYPTHTSLMVDYSYPRMAYDYHDYYPYYYGYPRYYYGPYFYPYFYGSFYSGPYYYPSMPGRRLLR